MVKVEEELDISLSYAILIFTLIAKSRIELDSSKFAEPFMANLLS